MGQLVNIGFGNLISSDKVLCIVSPDSAPAKRHVQQAKEERTLIDATSGRKSKSVIYTTTNKIILSALAPETLSGRFEQIS